MGGMSTSAEASPEPSGLRIVAAGYARALEVGLEEQIQAEYVARYGGPDETPMDADEFTPPHGRFLIGYSGGAAVACGGWRTHAPGTAEIKRMYVATGCRRRGLAARILSELERTAAEAGMTTMLLETGDAQPEAIALYTRAGYVGVDSFGYYRDSPRSLSLAKTLPAA